MYYAQMRKFDIANGVGIRATLFVSGCTHKCPGCFNEAYQNFHSGKPWDDAAEALFMDYVKNENVHGVTILGGEPMDQTMDDSLLKLLKRIKHETSHTIWIYSGYTFEQILAKPKRLAILELCDVLVDGPFIQELKNTRLKFRGSSNQRIINVQASLATHQIVEENL